MIGSDLRVYDSLCTGCSACTEACHIFDKNGIKAIQLITNEKNLAVPRINENTCTSCMLCYNACPVEDRIYNNEITFDKYLDKLGRPYYGYSLDTEHRFKSSTAGIATELASFLLETNRIDGVVSSFQNDENQIITKIFTDHEEIKKTRGSIYRQATILNGLADKVREGNFRKVLLIGLPCHIAGLDTLLKANKGLRKKCEFITIALFCKQTKTEEFSHVERRMLGAKFNQKIEYRGNGWPGFTRVEGDGRIAFNNVRLSALWGSYSFTPEYCFSCTDPLGIKADISVGDAWLKKYYEDNEGSSLVVANSEIGNELLLAAVASNKLYLADETKDSIINSQNYHALKFKVNSHKYIGMIYQDAPEYQILVISRKEKILVNFIKFTKIIYEFLYKQRIVDHTPSIILKGTNKLRKHIYEFLSSQD